MAGLARLSEGANLHAARPRARSVGEGVSHDPGGDRDRLGRFLGERPWPGAQAQLAFIPERHTDFILAVIAEELGFVGVSGLFAGYFLLLLRLLALALRSGLWAGQLFGGAAVAAIFIYTWVNAAMVMGIAPVVGVPLPFVSYGGTALMSLCWMVGVVASAAAERPLSGGGR